MQLGTYADGRGLTYDEVTGTFRIGEAHVTAEQVRGYEAAGQLVWATADIATWFHTSFPVDVMLAAEPAKSGKGGLVAVIAVVVLAVLLFGCGILFAIAIPVFNAAKMNAEKKSCWANERVIEGTAQIFQSDNGDLPDSIERLVPRYMPRVPVCPSGGEYSWDTGTGTTDCSVHGHY